MHLSDGRHAQWSSCCSSRRASPTALRQASCASSHARGSSLASRRLTPSLGLETPAIRPPLVLHATAAPQDLPSCSGSGNSIQARFPAVHAPPPHTSSSACHQGTTAPPSGITLGRGGSPTPWGAWGAAAASGATEPPPARSEGQASVAALCGKQGAQLSRRGALARLAVANVALGAATAAAAAPAHASKLPAFADQAWESMGGGPADLYFPDSFLGEWQVSSVLVSVEKPLGDEFVMNPGTVQRAVQNDLNKMTSYKVSFVRGPSGRVIFDRRYNTKAMLEMYYGDSVDFSERINWNPSDPNILSLTIPGGVAVRTRVTRRSAESPSPDRLETSEFLEQIFDDGVSPARLKASQCFTKYKWRDEQVAARAGGPAIVATQVVSDFLTVYDGEALFMKAMNKPVTSFTYKMAFSRPSA